MKKITKKPVKKTKKKIVKLTPEQTPACELGHIQSSRSVQPLGASGNGYHVQNSKPDEASRQEQTTKIADVQAIQDLIDAACFTNNEVMLKLKDKAEEALQKIMEDLHVYI